MSLDQMVRATVAEVVQEMLAEELPRLQNALHGTGNLPEVMTTNTLAEHLGCTPQHVTKLARTGALRGKKDGNRYLFLREWVIDYVASARSVPHMERAARDRLRNRRLSAPTGARLAMKEASASN